MSEHSLSKALSLQESYVNDISYYTVLESHLLAIKAISSAVTVSGNLADAYQGDFDGLLDYLHIPKKYHYLIRRINGYTNSLDFKGDVTQIMIPGGDRFRSVEIDQIISIYNSRQLT